MKLFFTSLFMFILLIIAFLFGSQNDQLITLNYLIAKVELPVASAVSLFVVIGFVLGLLFSLLWKIVNSWSADN